MPSSVATVTAILEQHGLAEKIRHMPDTTRSAQEAANAIGCTVAQIVKSLIFRSASNKPVLVLASGVNQVDTTKITDLLGEPIGKADADFVREQTGFAIGGVSPVGHSQPITTYIDADLLQYDEIWAAAGSPFAVFPLTPTLLTEMTSGEVVAVH